MLHVGEVVARKGTNGLGLIRFLYLLAAGLAGAYQYLHNFVVAQVF
jgi:hypothetical protein